MVEVMVGGLQGPVYTRLGKVTNPCPVEGASLLPVT